MPGWIGAVIPARGAGVAEAQEVLVLEEELGERRRGAGVELALEVVDVGRRARRLRVHLRIGRDRDLEVADRRAAPPPAPPRWRSRPDAARSGSRPWAGRRAAPRSAARPSGRSRAPPRASPRGSRRRRSGARRRSAAPGRRWSGSPRWCGRASCRRRRRSPRRSAAPAAPAARPTARAAGCASGECGGKNSNDRPGRALWVCRHVHRSIPTMKFAARENTAGNRVRQRLTRIRSRVLGGRGNGGGPHARGHHRLLARHPGAGHRRQRPARRRRCRCPSGSRPAIDRCAMRAGARDSDAYLAEWRKGEPYLVDGEAADVASGEAARLEAEFSPEAIKALIANDGWASPDDPERPGATRWRKSSTSSASPLRPRPGRGAALAALLAGLLHRGDAAHRREDRRLPRHPARRHPGLPRPHRRHRLRRDARHRPPPRRRGLRGHAALPGPRHRRAAPSSTPASPPTPTSACARRW